MPSAGAEEITRLLRAWAAGDQSAQERLVPLVYAELRRMARHYRHKASQSETLQATALVHEAYLRLVNIQQVDWKDRAHFFAVAAQLMRRILVDRARTRASLKRAGDTFLLAPPDFGAASAPDSGHSLDLIALDDALKQLEEFDPRRSRIVELRFFGGLSVEETAEAVAMSPQSVMRDWKVAKAWLLRQIGGTPDKRPPDR